MGAQPGARPIGNECNGAEKADARDVDDLPVGARDLARRHLIGGPYRLVSADGNRMSDRRVRCEVDSPGCPAF